MSILQLGEYDTCTFWLESLKAKSTLEAYTFHLSMFCKFHNTDPDELIQLSNSMTQLKTMILNYVIHLKKIAKQSAGKPRKGELSVNSVKLYLKGVKSFLEFNEIALPWKKIAKFYPDDVTNSYRSYTKEEIKKLLLIADPRDRCIILLMASSGIRVGAIQSLKVKSIKRLDGKVSIVTVYPESKGSVYTTLVTPEFLASFEGGMMSIKMLEDSYCRLHERDISEDYKKAIPSLTICEKRGTIKAQSYQELHDLRTQIEQHMLESMTVKVVVGLYLCSYA